MSTKQNQIIKNIQTLAKLQNSDLFVVFSSDDNFIVSDIELPPDLFGEAHDEMWIFKISPSGETSKQRVTAYDLLFDEAATLAKKEGLIE